LVDTGVLARCRRVFAHRRALLDASKTERRTKDARARLTTPCRGLPVS
jgi:hypothetical protein